MTTKLWRVCTDSYQVDQIAPYFVYWAFYLKDTSNVIVIESEGDTSLLLQRLSTFDESSCIDQVQSICPKEHHQHIQSHIVKLNTLLFIVLFNVY